jgi:serine/threonine protein phosphatase PrpC/cold shock CspA family protein
MEQVLFNGKPMIGRSKDGKYICLLCRRQFAAEQQLKLHCEMSALHTENMETHHDRITLCEDSKKRKSSPTLGRTESGDKGKKSRSGMSGTSGSPRSRSYGRIKFWNEAKGFGFVTVDVEDAAPGAEDLFVHRSKCVFASDDPSAVLFPEQEVSFIQSKQQDGRPCATDVKNADGTALPVPKSARKAQDTAKSAMELFAQKLLTHSYTDSWQGQKDRNEDRYTNAVINGMGAFFGLFDGHGGSTCSEYLAKNLQRNVRNAFQRAHQRAKSTRQRVKSGEAGQKDSDSDDGDGASAGAEGDDGKAGAGVRSSSSNNIAGMGSLEVDGPAPQSVLQSVLQSSFTEAYEETDAAYLQLAQRCKYMDGSTGLACMLYGSEPVVTSTASSADASSTPGLLLCVANAGDCRAVLCRGGEAVRLTTDHKPNTRSERQRIESAGGYVAQIKVRWCYSSACPPHHLV